MIIVFVLPVGISSCCMFKKDTPDLRIVWNAYPANALSNLAFDVNFTVANFPSGDCDAEMTSQGLVNLKMIKGESLVDFDENQVLNSLHSDGRQNFTFTVVLRTATTYHMIFTVDPENKTGDSNNGNNTFKADIIVQ